MHVRVNEAWQNMSTLKISRLHASFLLERLELCSIIRPNECDLSILHNHARLPLCIGIGLAFVVEAAVGENLSFALSAHDYGECFIESWMRGTDIGSSPIRYRSSEVLPTDSNRQGTPCALRLTFVGLERISGTSNM